MRTRCVSEVILRGYAGICEIGVGEYERAKSFLCSGLGSHIRVRWLVRCAVAPSMPASIQILPVVGSCGTDHSASLRVTQESNSQGGSRTPWCFIFSITYKSRTPVRIGWALGIISEQPSTTLRDVDLCPHLILISKFVDTLSLQPCGRCADDKTEHERLFLARSSSARLYSAKLLSSLLVYICIAYSKGRTTSSF
jgi:hypothetical protein